MTMTTTTTTTTPQQRPRLKNVQTDDTTTNENKRAKAKVRGVNHAVNQMLPSVEGGGVTKDEWEGIIDKIGKMFI